jgi:hypothetical protein
MPSFDLGGRAGLLSLSSLTLALLACPFLASAQTAAPTAFPATLAGHVVMPAQSFIAAPKDAPQDLQVSGKFTNGKRTEALGTVEGLSAGRPTGVSVPFKGQPLQGHSGIKKMPTAASGSSRTTALAPRPTRPTRCCT